MGHTSFPLKRILHGSTILFTVSLGFRGSGVRVASDVSGGVGEFGNSHAGLRRIFLGVLAGTGSTLTSYGCTPHLRFHTGGLSSGVLVRYRSGNYNVPARVISGLCRPFFAAGRGNANLNLTISGEVVRTRGKAVSVASSRAGKAVMSVALPTWAVECHWCRVPLKSFSLFFSELRTLSKGHGSVLLHRPSCLHLC